MISRKYLIDSYFYIGLLLFCLGKVIDNSFLNFYIYFNLIGFFIALYFLMNSAIFQRSYLFSIFYLGLVLFVIGNLLYISDTKVGLLYISDILFMIQIFLKQLFILISKNFLSILNNIKVLIILNSFVFAMSFYLSEFLNVYLIDLFYLMESLASLLILFYLVFFYQPVVDLYSSRINGIEIELLMLGQLFFLIGDLFYSEFNMLNLYFLGDYSDLFFFIGFAFFLKSANLLNSSKSYNLVKSYI